MKTYEIHAVVFFGDQHWLAACLEHDIIAQAKETGWDHQESAMESLFEMFICNIHMNREAQEEMEKDKTKKVVTPLSHKREHKTNSLSRAYEDGNVIRGHYPLQKTIKIRPWMDDYKIIIYYKLQPHMFLYEVGEPA